MLKSIILELQGIYGNNQDLSIIWIQASMSDKVVYYYYLPVL